MGNRAPGERTHSPITQPYDPRIAQQRERHGKVIKNTLLFKNQDQDKTEAEREN